jgi:hypothetical protein
MKKFLLAASLAMLGALFVGCQSRPAASAAVSEGKSSVRNNSASLLHELLSDEQNVSKLLIIKRDRDELHRLIKDISATAASGVKKLEELAGRDSTLQLKLTEVPAGEQAARMSIAKARTGELLRASGADFEFRLLLSQAEALSYGEHLAKVIAANETTPDRAKLFSDLSAQMQRLHGEVLKMLGAPKTRPGK